MPPDTTGLTGRFNANNLASLWQDTTRLVPVSADGDSVRAWDNIGSVADFTFFRAGVSVPLYETNVINGKAAVQFNPTLGAMLAYDNAFSIAQPTNDLITVSAWTAYFSILPTGDGGSNATIYNNPAIISDGLGYWGIHYKTVGGVDKIIAFNWDGAAKVASVDIGLSSARVKTVIKARFDGANVFIQLNNDTEVTGDASGNISNALASQPSLGATQQGGGAVADLLLGEALIYNINQTGAPATTTLNYMLNEYIRGAGGGAGKGNKGNKGGGGVQIQTPGGPNIFSTNPGVDIGSL